VAFNFLLIRKILPETYLLFKPDKKTNSFVKSLEKLNKILYFVYNCSWHAMWGGCVQVLQSCKSRNNLEVAPDTN
jgi:hypothetical protein